jgi:hypothetical protein
VAQGCHTLGGCQICYTEHTGCHQFERVLSTDPTRVVTPPGGCQIGYMDHFIPAVIHWCFGCHSRVSDRLHGQYWLSSINVKSANPAEARVGGDGGGVERVAALRGVE